jgi:hypothetical protein
MSNSRHSVSTPEEEEFFIVEPETDYTKPTVSLPNNATPSPTHVRAEQALHQNASQNRSPEHSVSFAFTAKIQKQQTLLIQAQEDLSQEKIATIHVMTQLQNIETQHHELQLQHANLRQCLRATREKLAAAELRKDFLQNTLNESEALVAQMMNPQVSPKAGDRYCISSAHRLFSHKKSISDFRNVFAHLKPSEAEAEAQRTIANSPT